MSSTGWIKQSILEIIEEKQAKDNNAPSGTSIAPGLIIGAIVGGSLAKNRSEAKYKKMYGNLAQRLLSEQDEKIEEAVEKALADRENKTPIPFNSPLVPYRSYTGDTLRDLRIVFTPLGVVFVKNGIVVDSIDVADLNNFGKQAWKIKDEEFFKRTYLNKLAIEMQLAEEVFARKLVEKNNSLKDFIAKRGQEEELIDFDYLNQDVFFNPYEAKESLEEISTIVKKSGESSLLAKYASDLLSSLDDVGEIIISDDLEVFKPFEHVNFDSSEKLAFPSLFGGHSISLPTNRKHVTDSLVVYFLPDRVLFVVDGNVLTQLTTIQMSENTYDNFKDDNLDYFKNLFLAKIDSFLEDMPELTSAFEKFAADNKFTPLFTQDNIHPKIYQQVFLDKFGKEWLDWDNEVIIKNIEDAFSVSKIELIPFNKIMCTKLIQVSDAPFMGFLSFEKVTRSFNNKHVDFDYIEGNVSPSELVFAIRSIYEISDIDVYDLISDHVYQYIKNILIENNCRVILPKSKTAKETSFFKLLTSDLLISWDELTIDGVTNPKNVGMLKKYNEAIHLATIKSLQRVKEGKLEETVGEELSSLGITGNDAAKDIVIKNVVDNIKIDKYLDDMDKLYNAQLKEFLA